MQTSGIPTKFYVPWADSGTKNTIPNASQVGVTAGLASWPTGFPPLTMTAVAAGGVPPYGEDFNGVLNAVSAAVRWQMAGGGYPFDATFASEVVGYPEGALLPSSDYKGYWFNTNDANANAPEASDSSTTGWVPGFQYGVTALTGLAASSVTLTSLQAAKERITLAGVLTANISIILPAWLKTWKVTNNCTGSFTVTVKTSAGTGVVVQQAGEAEVYGDGTNILIAAAKQVAAATNSGQAVNLGQAQADFAALAGSTTQVFNIADATTLTQAASLGQVQSGASNYAIDTGVANAYVASYTPSSGGVPTDGMVRTFKASTSNTGASTLAIDGGAAYPIYGSAGVALQTGEINAGGICTVMFNGTVGVWVITYSRGRIQAQNATASLHLLPVRQFQSDALVYAAASGTSSAIVVTRTVPVTAYTSGMRVKFLAPSTFTTNTGAVTLTVDGLTTVNLYGQNASVLEGGEIVAGGYYEAVYLGANFYLTSQVLGGIQIPNGTQSNHAINLGQAQIMFSPMQGPSPRMSGVAAAAGTTAVFKDDFVVVRTAAGQTYGLSEFSQTLDLTTTGIGGMDAGTATAAGFVLVYAAYNPTTGVQGIFGSMEAGGVATPVYSGGNLPSGYTATALIGILKVSTTAGTLVQSLQLGRRVIIPRITPVSGTAPATSLSWTSVSTTGIPYSARTISGQLSMTANNSGFTLQGSIAPYSSGVGSYDVLMSSSAGSISGNSTYADVMIATPQTFYYEFAASSSSSSVLYAIYINNFTF